MYGKEDGLVLAEDLCTLSWLKFFRIFRFKIDQLVTVY